jgi:hypothetical protein
MALARLDLELAVLHRVERDHDAIPERRPSLDLTLDKRPDLDTARDANIALSLPLPLLRCTIVAASMS